MARRLSVLIPDQLMGDAEAIARETGCSKSEVVREALRRYTTAERWRRTRRYGAERARAVGICSGDVESIIDELRGQDVSSDPSLPIS